MQLVQRRHHATSGGPRPLHGLLSSRGAHARREGAGASREQRLLQERRLLGQAEQQVHVLNGLPRRALDKVVDHCGKGMSACGGRDAGLQGCGPAHVQAGVTGGPSAGLRLHRRRRRAPDSTMARPGRRSSNTLMWQ